METAAGESGILFQLRWKIKRIAYAVEESGTSRAIYLAAGEEKLQRACRKIGNWDFIRKRQ